HGGVGGPDLLPGDGPAVTVAPGGGAQRGEIGTGLGLTESLTPDDLPAGDRREMFALLFGRSVPHDGRPDPVHTHILRAARFVLRPHLLAHHGLFPDRGTAPAELLRPG